MRQPVVDWTLASQLANNNQALAEEMLTMLMQSLPEERADIQTAYQAKDYIELKRLVHKLHGAVCYCGVPRLKAAAAALELALKQNNEVVYAELQEQLEFEIGLVIEYKINE